MRSARAENGLDVERVPMRWCRSQKPAKSAASVISVSAGCHPARGVQGNAVAELAFPEFRQESWAAAANG
jgi:hypothetical protein